MKSLFCASALFSIGLLLAVGCGSGGAEGLAILEVTVLPDVPSFMKLRFSVEDRADVGTREIAYDPTRPVRFGYYLSGPNGMRRIRAEALSAQKCVVGEGSATVDIEIGQISAAVPLTIARSLIPDSTCLANRDGGLDGPGDAPSVDGPNDHISDAPLSDAPRTDANGADRPDVGPDTPKPAIPDMAPDMPPDVAPQPPACLPAVQPCPGASACCPGLRCGTTSVGQVCCGDANATCKLAGGQDCCGDLECASGRCCVPPVAPCAGRESACCGGRVCGNTSAGRVCCGNAGVACSRPGGEDCCGLLECINGRCG
jgi:hypothetical protein